jgi:radical SAM protein with 4Fe4S-binding SPASM domain
MNSLDFYPHFDPETSLHLTPRGGVLFAGAEPSEIGKDETLFVESCSRSGTISASLPLHWQEEEGQIQLLVFVADLVASKCMVLGEKPSATPLLITGSRTANIPPHMSIELTADCNLKCRHCYRDAGHHLKERMPTETLIDILNRMADAGLRSVELTGGEPMLHPDVEDILKLCEKRFLMTGLLTNGTLFTDGVISQLQHMGKKALVSISLDGSTAGKHDIRRGVSGSFDKTIENLRKVTALGIPVRASMAVDEESFSDIEATLLLARAAGAFAFSYTPILPLGRGRKWAGPGWNLDGREVMRIEADLAKRYEGFLTVIPADKQADLDQGESCGAGYRTYTMDPNGDVRPCATYFEEVVMIGNLASQKIEDLFAHEATDAFAELPLPVKETCSGCDHELFCRYCGLRGMQASKTVEECGWAKLPQVKRVRQYWNAPN